MNRHLRKLSAIGLTVLLCACAAPRAPTYDENATETTGIVIAKTRVAGRVQISADSNVMSVVLIGVPGVNVLYLPFREVFANRSTIDIFEYKVRLSDGAIVSIFSEYFAFDLGNCVKVFQSSAPTYPRMAPWSGCV